MNLRKIIYDLFFKKKTRKSSRSSAARKRRNNTTKAVKQELPEVVLKNGKYDTTFLRQQVSETEYISNLRVGRSWILPQMVKMGFKQDGLSYKFDIEFFESNIRKKFDLSQSGRNHIWDLLKRNYKVIAASNGTSKRAKWWTKDLLIEMLKWDFGMTGRRWCGLDRQECNEILNTVWRITDYQQMYDLVVRYDKSRMRKREVATHLSLPDCFIEAYMGDGAYNAMMTMVKILGIKIQNDRGRTMSRDNCITEINKRTSIVNGRELLEYCKEKFFDSGAFECEKYMK